MEKSVIIKSGAGILKNIRDLIINHYGELTESDRFVAKTILNEPDAGHLNTIEDLAAFCSVSKSTIIRFTKKLGLEGFSELKVLLKMNRKLSQEVDEDFIHRVCDSDIQVINHYRNYDFTPIIKMLEQSPTIYAYGTGMFQKSFNKELQRLFMHADRWIRLIEGDGEFEVALNSMKAGDTVVIVSSSGENDYLEDKYDLLSLKGVHILSFTNSANNSLAYASDYNIATELTKERFHDQFYFDNIVTMYIPLKLLFAKYINYQVIKHEGKQASDS